MRQTLSLLILSLLSTFALAQLPQPVTTLDGMLQGEYLAADGVSVFRGIPYAAPPVGNNRWREPLAAASWSGVRDATSFASRCVQRGFAVGAQQAVASEDCLYLNVWTPATNPSAKLPVMLWIHGGGFFGGSGSDASYNGAALSSKGAVVITINYRLGSFGFFAHPELSAQASSKSSGNYALLDMLAAITWAKNNIEAFGGDANNITIMGESAGAKSVASLMLAPQAKDLFQRVILQSAGWMGWSGQDMSPQATLAEKEAEGLMQASSFGANSIAELREASSKDILDNFPAGGSIIVDGYLLSADSSTLIAEGKLLPVDILAGSNENEAVFFGPGIQTADEFSLFASTKYAALSDEYLSLYPATNDQEANQSYLQSYTDGIAWQLRTMAAKQAMSDNSAWLYFFTHVPPGQEARGATHVAELNYMFNHASLVNDASAIDKRLADDMSSYWINFAKSGNPNGDSLVQWPQYKSASVGSALVLGDQIEVESEQVPAANKLQFMDKALDALVMKLEQR